MLVAQCKAIENVARAPRDVSYHARMSRSACYVNLRGHVSYEMPSPCHYYFITLTLLCFCPQPVIGPLPTPASF